MQIWNLREVMDYQGFVTKTDISMQYDLFTQNTTTPKHFKTTFFAMYRREAEVSLRSYVLIDPLASEQQHSYCTGWKVNNGSHGLTGDASSIFEENSHGWGIPGTGCGGYFTLFFKEPIDMSGITKYDGNTTWGMNVVLVQLHLEVLIQIEYKWYLCSC